MTNTGNRIKLDFLRTTIAGRLYLVGALALVALSLLATATIYFALNTGRAAQIIYEDTLTSVVDAGELELLLERYGRVIETAPLEFDRAQIKRDGELAADAIQRMRELAARSGGAFQANVGPAIDQLDSLGRKILYLADHFAQDSALPIVADFAKKARELQALVRAHRGSAVSLAERDAGYLATGARRQVQAVIAIGIIAAVLIGPLSLMLLRTLVVKLRSLGNVMLRLAGNETDVELDVPRTADEIGDMARAVDIFRANAVQLLENKDRLEQLNQWLDIAFNNMARGLSLYDSNERLIVCNAAYASIYELPPELTRPGASFNDVLESRLPKLTEQNAPALKVRGEWRKLLNEQAEKHAELKLAQSLRDGRTVEMVVRPLKQGGWVAIHEDVTERIESHRRAAGWL
ncbi:MAG: PAS-domain containing protein, partial [Hyphomicrobiaceae bacterium]